MFRGKQTDYKTRTSCFMSVTQKCETELSLTTFTASLRGARNFILGSWFCFRRLFQRKICEVLLFV
jgi:hypothetical protein